MTSANELPPGVLAEVEASVLLYRALGERIGLLEEQRAELKARVNSLVDVGFSLRVEEELVQKISAPRSFDPEVAAQMLHPEIVKRCQVTGLDRKLIEKAARAFGVYEKAMMPKPGAAPTLRMG